MTSTIKLNLGAGYDHKPGWINADINPNTNPDIVVDLTKPLPFKDQSVSQISLQDVLEHLTKNQARFCLYQCHRILNSSGKLTLRIPNIVKIINQFGSDEPVMLDFIYGINKGQQTWGSHRSGYTENTISQLLKLTGFTQIKVTKETTNFIITAKKSTSFPPPINLLIIQQSPDWGGAEEWIASLVGQFRHQKIPVTAYTNLPLLKSAWKKAGAKVGHIPFILDIMGNFRGLVKSILLLPYALVFYLQLLYRARQDGINVILMSAFSEKLLVAWLAQLFNLSVVWFEYGSLNIIFKRNFYFPKIIYRLTKHLPSRVITLSQNTFESLITDARISQAKISLIPPGVKIPQASKPKSNLVVGHISRLTPEKGQRQLLYAWQQVSKAVPQAKLIIAGQGPDFNFLKDLAQKLNLNSSVKFQGFIKNKNQFFRSLSLFVFPTLWEMEGFGLVIPEAMSYSLPVIAYATGPVPEIISPQTGVLVKPGNVNALAQAIIKLLKNPSRLKRLGKSARIEVISKFNLTDQANKVKKELTDAISQNS